MNSADAQDKTAGGTPTDVNHDKQTQAPPAPQAPPLTQVEEKALQPPKAPQAPPQEAGGTQTPKPPQEVDLKSLTPEQLLERLKSTEDEKDRYLKMFKEAKEGRDKKKAELRELEKKYGLQQTVQTPSQPSESGDAALKDLQTQLANSQSEVETLKKLHALDSQRLRVQSLMTKHGAHPKMSAEWFTPSDDELSDSELETEFIQFKTDNPFLFGTGTPAPPGPGSATNPQRPVGGASQLTDQQREIARKAGMSEEEYLQYYRKD